MNSIRSLHPVQTILAAMLIAAAALPSTTSAQEALPQDILGRAAQVWSQGMRSPVAGRVTTSTDSVLILETEAPFCGPGGCVYSYSINWPDVDRLQIARLSSTNRGVRAAILGLTLGVLMGPVLHSCDDAESMRTCEGTVIGLSAAAGVAGWYFTRQSWEDVTLPRQPE